MSRRGIGAEPRATEASRSRSIGRTVRRHSLAPHLQLQHMYQRKVAITQFPLSLVHTEGEGEQYIPRPQTRIENYGKFQIILILILRAGPGKVRTRLKVHTIQYIPVYEYIYSFTSKHRLQKKCCSD